jgi:energy-coupling factor transporter ATP-binding protein EcfA2
MADHFTVDWDGYLSRIESATPVVEALGVTDYFSIGTYKRALKLKNAGRIPNVKFLFPNVELRLTVETEKKKGINIHLLFSPADPDHVLQIERILRLLQFEYGKSTYVCHPEDLARLGRAVDPTIKDEVAALRAGANQFKVGLGQLKNLFRTEKWLRGNCLVAVAGGPHDGTAGLQGDASFAAMREEIERLAHIVFSAHPGTRDFWLGRKPGFDRTFIERKFGYLKPCLHGSDAHRDDKIVAPEQDRMCWVKADLTFEGLRQAVIEPADRVYVGAQPPEAPGAFNRLQRVAVSGAPWFRSGGVPLNGGLVAIIGARGSGKTALADIIACGASALTGDSTASFVHRASNPPGLLEGATVQLDWSDGAHNAQPLRKPEVSFDSEDRGQVRYLSQQFVERLCASDGLATELVGEIEAVIFAATDETERLGAVSFEGLRTTRLEPVRNRRTSCEAAIQAATEQIADEEALSETLQAENKKLATVADKIAAAVKELDALVPKGSEERAKHLATLEALCAKAESTIQALRLRKQTVQELAKEIERVRTKEEPARLAGMKKRFAASGLTPEQWKAFEMAFKGDVDKVTAEIEALATAEIDRRLKDSAGQPIPAQLDSETPLPLLRAARDAAKALVGVDAVKTKRFNELKAQLASWGAEKSALEKHIAFIKGAEGRRKEQVALRRAAYAGVFDALTDAQKSLEELYQPLMLRLKSMPAAARLELSVVRSVDVRGWVDRGERLLDLRAAGAFRGRGSLRGIVEQELLPAWLTGGALEVAAAMSSFVDKYWNDIRVGRPSPANPDAIRQWSADVSGWLFATDHVKLRYGLKYDGVDVQRLSPGTRGIVLLTLYLAIDEWDRRPLIVDQPEENLDPRSVYLELVRFFRDAKTRRQVILVTHNANLVVNTDADQVIVASANITSPQGLPDISYVSGGLENKVIRDLVCDLLEGGEEAFLEREKRYRIRWGGDEMT